MAAFKFKFSFILILSLALPHFSWAVDGSAPNTPIEDGRAKIYPSLEKIEGGVRIKTHFHHAELESAVSLSLLAPIIDSEGNKQLIELVPIDDRFPHSKTDYHTDRVYDLKFDEMNKWLKEKAPNAELKVGPGTPLFVYARWMNQSWLDMYSDQPVVGRVITPYRPGVWNHQWGGIDREGAVKIPGATEDSRTEKSGFTRGGMTTQLDVTNELDQFTAKKYPKAGFSPGYFKVGSRFENELKLHVDVGDIKRIGDYFDALEKDPSLVEKTFGKGWVLKANRKYVGDPMIDIYLDNDKAQAAEKGMALRFRTGNNVTSLNFKPNDGNDRGKGVAERIEYDFRGLIDFTDPAYSSYQDYIKAILAFIDGTDSINPLQLVREVIPGLNPSELFKRKVKITDERMKYVLSAPTGDQVEISIDHVKARQLNEKGEEIGNQVEFGQLEVEVDHLGAQGSQNNSRSGRSFFEVSGTLHGEALTKYLAELKPGAVVAAALEPVFHGADDFKPDSPIKVARASNFALAFDVFDKIRSGAFQDKWNPAGQKYALVAAALGMLPAERFAPSVKRMVHHKLNKPDATEADMTSCLQMFVKINPM